MLAELFSFSVRAPKNPRRRNTQVGLGKSLKYIHYTYIDRLPLSGDAKEVKDVEVYIDPKTGVGVAHFKTVYKKERKPWDKPEDFMCLSPEETELWLAKFKRYLELPEEAKPKHFEDIMVGELETEFVRKDVDERIIKELEKCIKSFRQRLRR
jgi:hypothetical protein